MARTEEAVDATSQLTDASLQAFLQADFDPATFLNSALPALSTSNSVSESRGTYSSSASLQDVSTQAQSLLSKLSSQTTRLCNSLTQVVDEIVRSGGRLAYEVELLRGEAVGLSEALNHNLKAKFDIFLPQQASENREEKEDTAGEDELIEVPAQSGTPTAQPKYLARLQTLTTVRDRLDTVIKLFDEAMKWPMAPVASSVIPASLIAVTAPSSTDETAELIARAKEYIDDLRKELNAILSSGSEGGSLALRRIARLSATAEIWKGTSEEKQRAQVVEDMQRLVIEQYKGDSASAAPSTSRVGMDYRYGGTDTKIETGYGLLNTLRISRNEV